MVTTNQILLPDKWVRYLSKMPEKGMGYQIVNIVLSNGNILAKRKILNGSILLLSQDEKIGKQKIIKVEVV